MEIQTNDLIKALQEGKVDELVKLMDTIKSLISIYRDMNFIEVDICNRDGKITKDIKKKFPKFKVFWNGNEGTIGTNYVLVPSEMWNDEVKKELAKFDDFVGHFIDKHTEYEIDTTRQDLPYDLKILVKEGHIRRRSYDWDYIRNKQFFKPVEVIDREYDEELEVIDRRKYFTFDRFKDGVIKI